MPFTHNNALGWSTSSTGSTFTSSGDISNSDLYSQPFKLLNFTGYSIQLTTTGATVTGTFKLQASNDKEDGTSNTSTYVPTNWTDIADSSSTVSAAGTVLWNNGNAFYRWVRIVWTESGTATGTVTARAQGKGI
jgi:hypothetical protein